MTLTQRMARGAAVGAIAGFIMVGLIAVSDSVSTIVGALWIPVLLALAGAGFVLSGEGAQPYHLHEWAPLPAATIRQHAIRWFAAEGWALHVTEPRMLSLSRNTLNPRDLGCLVLLSGLLAFIYLMGRRNLTLTILLNPVAAGTEVEIIVSSRGGGQGAAVGFFNSLHDQT
ncbi:MAG: hypothetical protein M3464_16850 [Chloroflexota bacterium]|nr:hypothetical protein [Chloroflexota bacterium]